MIEQIKKYIASQPELKRSEMQELHRIILHIMPTCTLWFLDGKNSEGKTVSNPNIGYGSYTLKYADGKPGSFIKLVSVQTQPESPSTSWVLKIKHTWSKRLGKNWERQR